MQLHQILNLNNLFIVDITCDFLQLNQKIPFFQALQFYFAKSVKS